MFFFYYITLLTCIIDCGVPKGSKRHFWPFVTFHWLWHNSQ